jgi:hypothetical protein
VLEVLLDVAEQLGRSPAQVAVNWITRRPGVASTIVGATRLQQLEDNLRALEFEIPDELSSRLEEAGRPEAIFPYTFLGPSRPGSGRSEAAAGAARDSARQIPRALAGSLHRMNWASMAPSPLAAAPGSRACA